MKSYIAILMTILLSLISCQSKDKEVNTVSKEADKKEEPKGIWKVDKEFDENGNLIRYDSIYSWSSNDTLNDLTTMDKDSLLSNFESKFYQRFSTFKDQGFGDLFGQDSLFGNHFFNDDFFESDFGMDFMELDKFHKRMMDRQKKFLEKYRSDFNNKEKDSI
ncbi:hypothetical protein U8527_08790 [Kordia algicida OT-1]|uniref:Lipoprotein n=1 Tax=Kordia algicida OT-1 TaxID=391587 RepID=A9EDU7_9FLAO|nr:hypothetical protein [Kordia algicida]EDP94178.1 hypothetical protein KAOT1_02246 [Kordia algicida OT-1]